jgi:hypothetical protein
MMVEQIQALKTGECYTVPKSDYGKAEIWRVHDNFVVFEIPQYGGKPIYSGTYLKGQIGVIAKMIGGWT